MLFMYNYSNCSGYHYCTILIKRIKTQVLRKFKSCSWDVGSLRWWGSLTMALAGNKVKRFFLPNCKNSSSSSSSSSSSKVESSNFTMTVRLSHFDITLSWMWICSWGAIVILSLLINLLYCFALYKNWSFPLRISLVNVARSALFFQIWSYLIKKSLMESFIFCTLLGSASRAYCLI